MDELEGIRPATPGPEYKGPRRRPSYQILLRAVLILLLLVLSVVALWQGKVLALLAWLLAVLVLLDTSTNVLFGLCNEPRARGRGLMYWIASVFLGNPAVQMVLKSGEVRPVRPAGPLATLFYRLGAPSLVVIEGGVAAVFERGGRCTRVSGPGIVFTQRFERVAYVLDLRPQKRGREVKQILTQDGLSFDLERLDIVFEVAGAFDRSQGSYVVPDQVVYALVYEGGLLFKEKGKEVEWGDRVLDHVEHVLRNVAAQHTLEDLVRAGEEGGNARQGLLEELKTQAAAGLLSSGVRLTLVDVGHVVLPEELRDALTMGLKMRVDKGWAKAQQEAIIEVAKGLKAAFRLIRSSIQEVAGPTMPHVVVSLSDTLERVAKNFLQLTSPYRAGTEARRLLQGGEETPPPAE